MDLTRHLAKALPRQLRSLIGYPDRSYRAWIEAFDTVRDEDRARIAARIAVLPDRPLISVVMPVYDPPPQFLTRAIESVRAQLYPDWELCIADDASTKPEIRPLLARYAAADPRIRVVYRTENGHIARASNAALALARGAFVALLDHDDELPPHALYLIAAELAAHPDTDIFYSDEDKIDARGRRFSPYFKPDWNPDLFLAQNVISHLGVYRRSLVEAIGGFRTGFEGSQDYDLALRAIERAGPARLRHIPHILYHWRAFPGSAALRVEEKNYAPDAAKRAVEEHLLRTGRKADVTASPVRGLQRVRYLLDAEPRVSIIVPTKDKADMTSRCVEGILDRTDYRNLEILIVDNNSVESETHAFFDRAARDPRVRVLRYDAMFNFSAINNFAARQATGEVLVLLNNDTDVIDPHWLAEMVGNAMRPEIGAVGAKLLYPDGSIQHGGVIVGIGGLADHAFRGLERRDSGPFGRAQLQQNFSAVTGACLALRKSVYDEVGGMNERDLRVAYNDVDLCLRIRAKAYLIVWTPYAELYHHESATRGSDRAPARRPEFEREMKFLKEYWGEALRDDPYYNPNLSLDHANFELAFPPRAAKPW